MHVFVVLVVKLIVVLINISFPNYNVVSYLIGAYFAEYTGGLIGSQHAYHGGRRLSYYFTFTKLISY